ncbi:MAG: hypothetical protein QN173_01715 [Armatimonadota bacterium]|nr:hypothetical protein [Armatimonadota bacterium]MDR7401072.1 hypothetical protein [Armatimonadota bacterium]MDR7403576.1 hypothetical protein [Armatimonadota bacterium]MDR7436367.1 hypothetical protein [Armatimonadota bacterium]MDR7471723.1 hypothetical protein [Armatimonadota bacterium]
MKAYVSLGQDAVVRADDVVAVLDIRTLRSSPLNGPLLDRLEGAGGGAAGPCRSVVVTRTRAVACSLSVEAVRRRLETLGRGTAAPGLR